MTLSSGEGGRAKGMNDLARRLHDQGALREGITVEQAGHLLWLHSGFDAFDLLCTGRSLPADTVATLLSPPPNTPCAAPA